ncbi:FAD-binding domain-containing protein [Methylophilus methylotrophus]|uniref:FAD-binding domain-containing protein n=1 Tax=Methylophilus methylotrophus TaxID=17 RepID=UPI000F5AE456|nr:FAD-binding domain-containing protein [Methylophilus methylotrophus]
MSHPVRLSLATDRPTRMQQIAECFPHAPGPALDTAWQGGRTMALQRLQAVDVESYARSRNHLSGAVTRLSPYLRHGCISLPEALEHVLKHSDKRASKLASELSYRDYFRQVWYRFGTQIMQEIEPPKVTLGHNPLPDFISQGFTGLICMDEIVRSLQQQGYVHNHARMWLAAYLLHWLKVDWRQAADWFEQQLLDGDIASNHLSWQWVASSFSNKPYYFNKENIIQFGGEAWCQQCKIKCPFASSYEALQQRLFPENIRDNGETDLQPLANTSQSPLSTTSHALSELVWVHDEMLSPEHPLHMLDIPAIFVFDPEIHGHWPLKRLQFMADCLAEMPGTQIWHGNTRQVLTKLSQGQISSMDTPQPVLKQAVAGLQVRWQPEKRITDVTLTDHQLMRFSRYWKVVAPTLNDRFYTA